MPSIETGVRIVIDKVITENTIVELIESNPDYNFVGMVVTPWHAHALDAFILSCKNKGIMLKGVIIGTRHPISRRCIDRENILFCGDDIAYIEGDMESKSLIRKTCNMILSLLRINNKSFNSGEKIFYFVRPSYPDFNCVNILKKSKRKERIMFVSIDEGCGSYLSDDKKSWTYAISSLYQNEKALKRVVMTRIISILSIFRSVARKMIVKSLTRRGMFERHEMLKKNYDGKYIKNEEVCNTLREVLHRYSIKENVINEKDFFSNCIIINTSPLENEQDMKIWDEVIPVLKRYGYPIVIKTHPREENAKKYEKYDCMIFDSHNQSQEVLISGIESLPRLVVSVNSSTLVNLKLLFGIPSVSLAKLSIGESSDKYYIESIKNYINTFEDMVYFPDSMIELSKFIQGLLGDNYE